MGTRNVILFDFDNTVGDCSEMSHVMSSVMTGSNLDFSRRSTFRLREGIHNLLRQLKLLNVESYITTRMPQEYGEEALEKCGLSSFFDGAYGAQDTSFDIESKKYERVLNKLDISQDDAKHNVLVIGDTLFDAPQDLKGVVYIHDEKGINHHASLLEKIIISLLDNGNRSFSQGFEFMYQRGIRSLQGNISYNMIKKQCPIVTDSSFLMLNNLSAPLHRVTPMRRVYREGCSPYVPSRNETLPEVPSLVY